MSDVAFQTSDRGVALLCDRNGYVLEVLRDDTGFAAAATGRPLHELVDAGSREKALLFVGELRLRHALFDWELHVPSAGDGPVGTMHFGGVAQENRLLVFGCDSRAATYRFYEALSGINNELATDKRTFAWAQLLSQGTTGAQDTTSTLAELTRLNNDLANAQREVARRNEQLLSVNAELQALRSELEVKNAALVAANQKLESLATFDELTGVHNRRAFNERLDDELRRLQRDRLPLSLLLADIDHFKKINDTYGHPAGDAALKLVAATLRGKIRTTDFVARYGGEEFAVILPNTGVAGALTLAERLRTAVESVSQGRSGDATPKLTVSLGAASLECADCGASDFLAAADAALYRAKRAGRNRVVHARGVPADA